MKNGFTLIELLMAITLVGMVVLSFGALQGIAHSFLFQSQGMAKAQGEASYAMLHIKRNLSKANRVIVWSPTMIGFRYDHRSIAVGTATPADPNDDEWDYYRLNGTTLEYFQYVPPPTIPPIRNSGWGSAQPNGADPLPLASGFTDEEDSARGVTALAFTGVSPYYEVDVDMTVQQQVGRQARSTRVRGSITPRGVGSP